MIVTAEDKELQAFVRGIVQSVVKVDLYPKTLIQIVVQELESDRPHLSLALNCICAALLDSGICLKMTFAATAAAVLPSGRVLVHPSHQQLTESSSLLTTVFDSCSEQILAVRLQGRPLSRDKIRECVRVSQEECRQVWQTLSSVVKNSQKE